MKKHWRKLEIAFGLLAGPVSAYLPDSFWTNLSVFVATFLVTHALISWGLEKLGFTRSSIATEESVQAIREAYIVSERPWVSVDAAIASDLVRQPHGIEFSVNFTVKNNGKSPARNVCVFYKVVTLKLEGDQFGGSRQETTKLGKSSFGENMGIQLFPGEVSEIRWTSPLTNEEIDRAHKSHSPPAGFLPSFYIIGSVFYKSTFNEEIHQTGFNYYVCAIGDSRYPKGSDVPIFTNTFPMARIVLDSVPYYKGTID